MFYAQVEGIPPGWDAHRVLSGDPRYPTIAWRRTTIHKAPVPKIALSFKYRLDLTRLKEESEKERARKEEARARERKHEGPEAVDQAADMDDDVQALDGPTGGDAFQLL